MSSPRQTYSSGSPWEITVGYSRAVKVGPFIQVAGTTAVDEEGQPVGVGDPYRQTVCILQKIEQALNHFGTDLTAVTRTRLFVVDIDQWEAIGRAHGEFFGSVRPASTMVEVSRLIAPELLVEIEVEAFVEA
ncbi:MAG: RidA family protein [Candidatus Latescibacteria bacterium]|nr:RidA family protein [Candidatus Latescibacterota bacterium]